MTAIHEMTLEQLLEAREHRAAYQKKLIEKYRLPVVSFTVNIPGARKKTPESSMIFREGCNVLLKTIKATGCELVYYASNDPKAEYEAHFVVNTAEKALKTHMLQIENEHPLGRLFDLDVIGADGRPISREDLGTSKRKCLLCDRDAHSCGRSRRHPIEALLQKIQSMVDSFLKIKS